MAENVTIKLITCPNPKCDGDVKKLGKEKFGDGYWFECKKCGYDFLVFSNIKEGVQK